MHSEGIGTQRAAGDGHVTNLIPIDAHVLVIDESKADPGGLAGSDDGLVDPDGGGHGAGLSQWGEEYADGRLNVGGRGFECREGGGGDGASPLDGRDGWTGLIWFRSPLAARATANEGVGDARCPPGGGGTTTCTPDNPETKFTAPEYSGFATHPPGACCPGGVSQVRACAKVLSAPRLRVRFRHGIRQRQGARALVSRHRSD